VEAIRWHWQDELRELAEGGRPDEWLMTPQTVNAYYNPLRHEIVFPAAYPAAALLQPQADDAVNYGAIGATIGHEKSAMVSTMQVHGTTGPANSPTGGRTRTQAVRKLTANLAGQYDAVSL
jgi:putative endopeptidase